MAKIQSAPRDEWATGHLKTETHWAASPLMDDDIRPELQTHNPSLSVSVKQGDANVQSRSDVDQIV